MMKNLRAPKECMTNWLLTIEIYIHRGELRCFLTIESAPSHLNRVIEYILYTFLSCSVDEPVRQRAAKSCRYDETDLAGLSRQASYV